MRKIGYARVSSPHQNVDRQNGALRAERCHEIFREKASGKSLMSALGFGNPSAAIF
jgi:DNA invertase Pin-like site-specific DNA recombinase